MTERPIIFSGPMVRALLEGRKTQTRRALYGKTGRMVAAASVKRGDRLYVREAMDIAPKGAVVLTYAADSVPVDVTNAPVEVLAKGYVVPGRMPGMFMPRWASRLTLRVTAVRTERLQSISEADAKAEGVIQSWATEQRRAGTWRQGYELLWESLHGLESWDANPEVVVLTFERERA